MTDSPGAKPGLEPKAPSEINLKVLLKQIGDYVPGTLLTAFTGLISSVVFTHIFDVTAYGRYSLVMSLIIIGTALANEWLQQATIRYLPTDFQGIEQIKRTVLLGMFLNTSIVMAVSVSVIAAFYWLFDPLWRPFLVPVIATLLVNVVVGTVSSVLQAQTQARHVSTYQAASGVVRLVLSYCMVVFFWSHPAGVVWGNLVGTIVLVPSLWRRAEMPGIVSTMRGAKSLLKGLRQFRVYGLPLVGWFLAAHILNAGDRWIIHAARGASELGIYSANYGLIFGSVSLAASPIIMAAHPFLMRAWEQGNRDEVAYWLGLIIQWLAIAGMLLVGVTVLFSHDLARWFLGRPFWSGHVIMPFVVGGVVALHLANYAHKPLEFTGKTKIMLYCKLGATGLNLLLNIALVSKYGYVMAAYTTLICYLLYAGLVGVIGRKVVPWKVNLRLLGASMFIIIFGVAAANSLRAWIEGDYGYLAGLFSALFLATTMTGGVVAWIGWPLLRRKLLSKSRPT